MDGSRFDNLVSRLEERGDRRHALNFLGAGALIAGAFHPSAYDASAGRRKKKRKKKGGKGKGGGDKLGLGEICTPGKST